MRSTSIQVSKLKEVTGQKKLHHWVCLKQIRPRHLSSLFFKGKETPFQTCRAKTNHLRWVSNFKIQVVIQGNKKILLILSEMEALSLSEIHNFQTQINKMGKLLIMLSKPRTKEEQITYQAVMSFSLVRKLKALSTKRNKLQSLLLFKAIQCLEGLKRRQ